MRQESGHWREAIELLGKCENGAAHLDDLLERVELGEARWLVMETFRQWLVIDGLLQARIRRKPRPVLQHLLRLALTECLHREQDFRPRIVHHAVEVARLLGLSKAEQGFVNGVLRSILRAGEAIGEASLERSHPAWMVKRWKDRFGEVATGKLLEWNQASPVVTIRAQACPPYAQPTLWPGYFQLASGGFPRALPDLQAGTVYAQDPFARIPVELLEPRPGETILDLCAAPGGKTRLIAESMAGKGRLVAVDKPGRRLDRLKENIARMDPSTIEVVGCAVEEIGQLELPSLGALSADGVLIDVPCSNTGVIRRRPDVKLRLGEGDIPILQGVQLALLEHAARWTGPSGRLVYSTCSLEREENEDVVGIFCRRNPGWRLVRAELSRPWECSHDGGGAFLLTRDEGR